MAKGSEAICNANTYGVGGAVRPRRGGGRSGANGALQGKRVTFPWINSQIVAAAETGNLHSLLAIIATHLHEMNLVNISTALHRLAKLTQSRPTQAQQQASLPYTLQALLESARQSMTKLKLSGSTPKCQSLSNITWALATMKVVDLPLMKMVAASSHNQIADFKSFELCQLLWAFAKLGTVEQTVWDDTAALFGMAAHLIVSKIGEFSFRGLVMTAWAFATAKRTDSRLFYAIAMQLTPSLHLANCQELANTAWSFSTAGVHDQFLFDGLASVALPRLREFKPQELSSILWSFASIGHMHDEFYDNAGKAALEMQLQAQQLANILWSLAKMKPLHESTQGVVLVLLPRCAQLLDTFKSQELASVALAAGKVFGNSPEGEETDRPMPIQVVGFFRAIRPIAVANLREFSGQSLANIASSFLAVRAGDLLDFFLSVSHEIGNPSRVESLENSALLLLLKTLPHAPQSEPLNNAIAALFDEAARRIATLPARELHVLARMCPRLLSGKNAALLDMIARLSTRASSAPCDNREDLRELCLMAAACYRRGDILHQDAGGDVDDDRDQTKDTKNSSGETSEIPSKVFNRWAAPVTFTIASSGRPPSNWDAHAIEKLRQDMGLFAARREESAPEPVAAKVPTTSSRSQSPNREMVVSVSIKNTFLDIDEGRVSDPKDIDTPLEPALDCIPDCVSAEKLQAHRMNYRRFRTGDGIGAKGEWDAVVIPEAADTEEVCIESEEKPNVDLDQWTAPITLTVANTGRPASNWDVQATEELRQGMESIASRREEATRERTSSNAHTALPIPEPQIKDIVVNVSVKNTFIDADDGSSSEDDLMDIPLGPSLDVIPDSVSPEKLLAYRLNYQKFRAGNGIGAKGELDAVS